MTVTRVAIGAVALMLACLQAAAPASAAPESAAATSRANRLLDPACDPAAARRFESLHLSDRNIRFWWMKSRREPHKPMANALARVLHNPIWDVLARVMYHGRSAVPDQTPDVRYRCSGPDGAMDIYIGIRLGDKELSTSSDMTGITQGQAITPGQTPDCVPKPVYIYLHPSADRETLAHEVMHAMQFQRPRRHCLSSSWRWMDEAVATWAQVRVFGRGSHAPAFDELIVDRRAGIESVRGHNGWALLYSVVKSLGSDRVITNLYIHGMRQDALQALDATIQQLDPAGGLPTEWSTFARRAWNRKLLPTAVPQSFRTWLGVTAIPKDVRPQRLSAGNNPQHVTLDSYGKDYRRYDFGDRKARFIRFADPGAKGADAGLQVHALIKVRQNWTHEDWTGLDARSFCRVDPRDDVSRVVLVYTTSTWRRYATRPVVDTRKPSVELRAKCPPRPALRYNATFSGVETEEGGDASSRTEALVTLTGYHTARPFSPPRTYVEMVGGHSKEVRRNWWFDTELPLTTIEFHNDRSALGMIMTTDKRWEISFGGYYDGFKGSIRFTELDDHVVVPMSYDAGTNAGSGTLLLTRVPR